MFRIYEINIPQSPQMSSLQFMEVFLFLNLYKSIIMIMDDNTNVTFEQIGEFEYKVMDDEGNRFFIGELDDALDTYSAWTEGKEPPFELDYTVDLENVEIIIEFEDDED